LVHATRTSAALLLISRSAIPLICAALCLFALAPPAKADPGDTLSNIRNRGYLRCGVSQGITGFSMRDSTGHWAGIDADFCRAVAAAALGNPSKVQFIPLNTTARFPALELQEIDILARNTTWTVFREPTFQVQFTGVLYYDSEGFITAKTGPYAHTATLDGATICVQDGSNEAANITEYARVHNLHVSLLNTANLKAARQQFAAGACSVLTDDLSTLADMLLHVPNPDDFIIRPEHIAREPFSPAVRWDDPDWIALVRAVYAALIDADARGLTQAEAATIGATGSNPMTIAYLSETAPIGRALSLAPNWAAKAVAAAGNYGEIFNRNLGAASPLKLDPGPNKPWTEGGLLYAPPFQ
jgi:general L-amino acid transport system substrate-binding protein